ncbi:alpha-1,3/1,6-mannosyltransferase Alg2 [Oratosquilla oratoria]|uniref:alpha-1,3/1,6-mannosyltransferase Alg2 n=1 Tax=Oratosquilla oratoria TaxID=337810 RepID=UPI003F764725
MVRVTFLHPDLGIGGAERLVVDAAIALKDKGHEVEFYTSHHDPSHCFPETIDGTVKVTSVGDWLPRSFLGKFYAFWAYVRMIYLALYLRFFSKANYDVLFVDQVSACIPVLKIKSKAKVLFYCHYPDMLLTKRLSFAKKVYRFFLDKLEECTTSSADSVLVNSHFTAGVFQSTFKSIQNKPGVLYPSLNFNSFDKLANQDHKIFSTVGIPALVEIVFVSINRFERKKNLGLALWSLKELLTKVDGNLAGKIHLVMAGGYDSLNEENIEHYEELVQLTNKLGLKEHVTFLKSPEEIVKVGLLENATCLIYTPDKEHFGIVPIEAMYVGTPVIAVNSGGPTETVVDGETGFLCDQTAEAFSNAMLNFCNRTTSKESMTLRCKKHVKSKFSFEAFARMLDYEVQGLIDERKRK